MKSQIIKGLTLILFSSLIIAFVAFRSGFFGGNKSTLLESPNGSTLNNQIDSVPRTDSLKTIQMMSSSKVLILRDHSVQVEDSIRLKPDSSNKVNPHIYSSKSGIILNSKDLNYIIPDSTVADSLTKE